MREQFMMYGVLSPDPNLGRYKYTTVRFPCQCLGGAILVPSFCLVRQVKKYQQEVCNRKRMSIRIFCQVRIFHQLKPELLLLAAAFPEDHW